MTQEFILVEFHRDLCQNDNIEWYQCVECVQGALELPQDLENFCDLDLPTCDLPEKCCASCLHLLAFCFQYGRPIYYLDSTFQSIEDTITLRLRYIEAHFDRKYRRRGYFSFFLSFR